MASSNSVPLLTLPSRVFWLLDLVRGIIRCSFLIELGSVFVLTFEPLSLPAEKRVVPGSGPDQYKFASFMSVTLSCDHRVIDGRSNMTFNFL